jgi:hypothetical protein
MRLKVVGLVGILSVFFMLNACVKKENPAPKPYTPFGNISIKLTDLPANYLEVNVDINQVSVHVVADSTNNSGGWIDLPTKAGIYNLLKLQNGIDTTIVDSTATLPAGKITQMRLLLGANNSVMTNDSIIHALKVPSGSQSGIKLVGKMYVNAGKVTPVLIDFDAAASVVNQGNGGFSLKPVIKVIP